jgi:hypothetical protein
MKVLIITLVILGTLTMCQSDHPMLGKPDHYRPQPTPSPEQAKAHSSGQDAMEVHPLPQPQSNEVHPMLGQNDGHDNIHQDNTPFSHPTPNKNIPMPGQNDGHERWQRDGEHHK